MQNRHGHPDEEHPGLEGPDYVTLLIEWDNLADDLDRGMATASSEAMPTKDADWIIDEAGIESFPASDPPAWGSSRAAPSESTIQGEQPEAKTKKIRSRKRMPILLGVVGLFALTGFLATRAWWRSR